MILRATLTKLSLKVNATRVYAKLRDDEQVALKNFVDMENIRNLSVSLRTYIENLIDVSNDYIAKIFMNYNIFVLVYKKCITGQMYRKDCNACVCDITGLNLVCTQLKCHLWVLPNFFSTIWSHIKSFIGLS